MQSMLRIATSVAGRRLGLLGALLICTLSLVSAPNARAASGGSSADRIVVSGASGQLGGLAVKALLDRGVAPANLILVSRTPDKLAEYAKLGASVRFGDLTQPASLTSAYAGGTRMLLISITPTGTPRPELHKAAFEAAAKAGIKQIVYTSFVNLEHSESPLALDHRRSEAFLKASGVPWTMMRNSIYTDMLIQQAAKMAATGRAEVAADDAPIAYVTRADCAAAAAGALTSRGHDFKAYDITGPELVSRRQLAAIVSEITGKPIEVVVVPKAPGPGGADLSVKTDAVEKLTGHAPQSVRAFLEANKAQLTSVAP